MFKTRNCVRAVFFGLLVVCSSALFAQDDPQEGPLADGKLSKQELAAILLTAEHQLTILADHATEEYLPAVRSGGVKMPEAWMLMSDGESIKRLDLQGQVDGAPPELRILMYRAALKSVARRGVINAGAILYAGSVSEDKDGEALVIEHEHRLGVSANKVVGYELQGGKVIWGKPVTTRKPFQWFYDAKENAT